MTVIKPQAIQEVALTCKSTIILYGGSKGGGKSFTLRLMPMYHIDVAGYYAVIFRRSLKQNKTSGGLWDKSYDLYPYFGGDPNISELKWTFPSGAKIQFSQLFLENSAKDWAGSEVAFFGFDQLEDISYNNFLTILSCMRTTCGVPTQILATMNPDSQSWVRDFVDPWIAEDGYVDLEQNQTEKYFTIKDNKIEWVTADWRGANNQPPVSVTYISAEIWDNQILLDSDKSYLSNLQSLAFVDRERFLGKKGRGGNWNIKAEAGKVFKYTWFQVVNNYVRQAGDEFVRFYDFAFSQIALKKGDFISSCLMVKTQSEYIALEVTEEKLSPSECDRRMLNQAKLDTQNYGYVPIRWQQEPGASGVSQSAQLQNVLAGYNATHIWDNRSKLSRAKDVSIVTETGKLKFLQGAWNNSTFAQLESFPDGEHDDKVDSISGAFNYFQVSSLSFGKYKF